MSQGNYFLRTFNNPEPWNRLSSNKFEWNFVNNASDYSSPGGSSDYESSGVGGGGGGSHFSYEFGSDPHFESSSVLPTSVMEVVLGDERASERDSETAVQDGPDVFNVHWISAILMAFLVVVTIVGNVLVCLSVILVRKLRKPQNYLLVSLATSDLFVALFVMPFAILVEFYQSHWPLNAGLCDLWVSADVLCCTASILNLCGISVDRYQAITAPFDYSARSTPRRMLTVIFVVWLGSACVSLPPVLLIGNEHFDSRGVPTCSVSQNFWYQIYATMASFYIPLCVMVVVYAKILRVVTDKKKEMNWKKKSCSLPGHFQRTPSLSTTSGTDARRNQIQMSQIRNIVVTSKPAGTSPTTRLTPRTSLDVGASEGGDRRLSSEKHQQRLQDQKDDNTEDEEDAAQRARRSLLPCISIPVPPRKKKRFLGGLKEHKASTTLGIIMSAFIICWLPFFVLALVRPIFHVEIPEWISSLFNWLGYANSALNPVIYATLNRDFRRPFREILSFRCATLDSMMRKEFYLEQYGEDTDNLRNKASVTLIFLENGNISEPLL